jgi:PAS domain S-box-containing protein
MPDESILVADDDRGVLSILKRILRKEGYEVFLASNGKEALDIVKNDSIDVAILDMKMPVLGGIEALREIKVLDPQIQVLIMTAYANIESVRQSIVGHGAFDYILKPFHKTEILHAVENALIRRKLMLHNRLLKKELEERVFQLEGEFKERTRQLRESQIKYRDILENSNDMIVITQNGRIKFFNDRSIALTGHSPKELFNLALLEMVHPEDRPSVEENQENLMEREDLHTTYSFRMLEKSGEPFWVKNHAIRTIWDEKPAYINILRDMSEHKQAEQALHDSQERFITVLDSIDADISVTDLETHEILLMNKHMKDSFGSDLVGKVCWRVFRNESGPCGHCKIDGLLNKDGNPTGVHVWEGQNPVTGKYYVNYDRAIRWVDGRFVRLQVATDITQIKHMEEELRKAQKLESLGVLAGGIAHDFNNILAIILGNIALAKIDLKREDRIHELLQEAEKALSKATALTQQLLTFSKGGAPVKKTASISEVIEESSSFALRGSKTRCDVVLPDDLWPLEMDSGQISQVIHNLVINADHAMPDGGAIQVQGENLIVEDAQGLPLRPGKYIRVSLQDKGIGIAPEHQSRLFDPYFTTKQKGSGLGLAVAYSIIKHHDGYITVESELGEGTTFCIYLPASEKEPSRPEEREEKVPIGDGKILLMDDEESVRRITGQMLTRMGYEVKFAHDGAEAIEVYREAMKARDPFDAVIMDLTVPGGMGGKEAIQKLKKIDSEVKAILCSGYSNDPVMSDFRKYHFRGVVNKPFNIEELGDALRSVIS